MPWTRLRGLDDEWEKRLNGAVGSQLMREFERGCRGYNEAHAHTEYVRAKIEKGTGRDCRHLKVQMVVAEGVEAAYVKGMMDMFEYINAEAGAEVAESLRKYVGWETA